MCRAQAGLGVPSPDTLGRRYLGPASPVQIPNYLQYSQS